MFDLTQAFEKIGHLFARGLGKRVFDQEGIDGMPYSYVKPSTAKSRGKRRQRKGEAVIRGIPTTFGGFAMSLKRLWVTGRFAKAGFNYVADATGTTVFVSENMHPAGATYAEIVRRNSRGQKRINRGIEDPPLVFPNNASEVRMMKEEMTQAAQIIKNELVRQIKEQGLVVARRELNIG